MTPTTSSLEQRVAELERENARLRAIVKLAACIDIDNPTEHDEALIEDVVTQARQESMTGFWPTLTPEQQASILARSALSKENG